MADNDTLYEEICSRIKPDRDQWVPIEGDDGIEPRDEGTKQIWTPELLADGEQGSLPSFLSSPHTPEEEDISHYVDNLNINWPTFPGPSVTEIVDGQLGGNKPDRGSSNPPRVSTEVDQCDEGTDGREPAGRGIPIQLQPLQPGENITKRRGTPHHPKNDGPSDATLSPRLGPPSLLDQVNTLAQPTSQVPTEGGKKNRGGKTCFEYPPKETKKYQGKVKSSNKGEPPSKRIQIDGPGTKASIPKTMQDAAAQQLKDIGQTPHKDEEKVRKQVTSKFTDKTEKQCDPADARRCASWAGEYVAGEPVEVSPRVPPGWVVATWGGDYFICPKERCPTYGK
ncbi:putative transcription factor D5 [Dissostichus eleginoides]|uniref:Transcription factor D5 n=1 Tax=Dissostichus eleginoides TaxID=100907 RepID=A0AAD9FKF1_DISEL|nr:putative transcription factor D5 [Dissostichus eleginoides]